MEVLVRNLDELEDVILVSLQRLFWRTPAVSGYKALLVALIFVVIP